MRTSFLLLLLFCLSAHMSAYAEEQDLFALSLEQLSQVMVTGSTLTPTNLRDTPATVTVYTREEIAKLPVHTLNQLVNYVPGMQSVRYFDNGLNKTSSIRGRRTASGAREILVLLNGMRIDNFFNGGVTDAYPHIPLANVKRVEFVRGPVSAIYGTNAFTGMINIITDENTSQVQTAVGSHGFKSADLQQRIAGGPLHGSLYLHATRDQGEWFQVQNSFGPGTVSTRDPYQNYSGQLRLHINGDTTLQWVFARNLTEGFYTLGTVDDSVNKFRTDFNGLMLEHELNLRDDIRTKLVAGLQYNRNRVTDHVFIPMTLGPAPLYLQPDFVTRDYYLRLHNDWTLSASASLQFGAEYRRPAIVNGKVASNYNLEQIGAPSVDYYGDFSHRFLLAREDNIEIGGVYGQYQTHWNDRIDTLFGLRYDNYSQVGDILSPRAAVIFHGTRADTFKMLYGKAFRAPTGAEIYGFNNQPALGGDLKPDEESVQTWELVWLHQATDWNMVLNYFYNDFAPARQAVQGGHEHSNGVEAELVANPLTSLQLHLTGSYLFDRPDIVSQESAKLYSATAVYSRGMGYGSLSLNYQGPKPGNPAPYPSYWIANLKLGYHWQKQLETYGEVLNLTDREYVSTLPLSSAGGIPNRRREFRVGLEYSY